MQRLWTTLGIIAGAAALVGALYAISGNPRRPMDFVSQTPPRRLVQVEIHLPGEVLDAYIAEPSERDVLNGGVTVTKLYDADGNQTGVLNYGKVNYIRYIK